MYYIRYIDKEDGDWSIYETSEDLTEERCIAGSGGVDDKAWWAMDDENFGNLSMFYDIDVLTKDEVFIYLI